MEYFVTSDKDIIAPGKTGSFFRLSLNTDCYTPSQIIKIDTSRNEFLLIISQPKRKWYKLLAQYCTFGLYKAPWEYKLKNLTI